MRKNIAAAWLNFWFRAFRCALIFSWAAVTSVAAPVNLSKVYSADPQTLLTARLALATNAPALLPAFQHLLAEADKLLAAKPSSVMDKKQVPPSGDQHDYMSQAPYFWRDTNSPNGKYIRRDGERNPESNNDSDAGRLGKVNSGAHTLALAYFFLAMKNMRPRQLNSSTFSF